MHWCQDAHDEFGECVIERPVDADGGSVVLTGVPCDHARIDLRLEFLTEVAEVDRMVAALTELRQLLEASDADLDCDAHDHDEDEDDDEAADDEDDEDFPCDRCSADDVNLLRVILQGQHFWWCRSCCEAEGVEWGVPG